MNYRIPYLRDWVTIYTDSLTTDNITAFADLPRAAFAPGIYLTHFPKLPKWDLRLEACLHGHAKGLDCAPHASLCRRTVQLLGQFLPRSLYQ